MISSLNRLFVPRSCHATEDGFRYLDDDTPTMPQRVQSLSVKTTPVQQLTSRSKSVSTPTDERIRSLTESSVVVESKMRNSFKQIIENKISIVDFSHHVPPANVIRSVLSRNVKHNLCLLLRSSHFEAYSLRKFVDIMTSPSLQPSPSYILDLRSNDMSLSDLESGIDVIAKSKLIVYLIVDCVDCDISSLMREKRDLFITDSGLLKQFDCLVTKSLKETFDQIARTEMHSYEYSNSDGPIVESSYVPTNPPEFIQFNGDIFWTREGDVYGLLVPASINWKMEYKFNQDVNYIVTYGTQTTQMKGYTGILTFKSEINPPRDIVFQGVDVQTFKVFYANEEELILRRFLMSDEVILKHN